MTPGVDLCLIYWSDRHFYSNCATDKTQTSHSHLRLPATVTQTAAADTTRDGQFLGTSDSDRSVVTFFVGTTSELGQKHRRLPHRPAALPSPDLQTVLAQSTSVQSDIVRRYSSEATRVVTIRVHVHVHVCTCTCVCRWHVSWQNYMYSLYSMSYTQRQTTNSV